MGGHIVASIGRILDVKPGAPCGSLCAHILDDKLEFDDCSISEQWVCSYPACHSDHCWIRSRSSVLWHYRHSFGPCWCKDYLARIWDGAGCIFCVRALPRSRLCLGHCRGNNSGTCACTCLELEAALERCSDLCAGFHLGCDPVYERRHAGICSSIHTAGDAWNGCDN